MELEAALERPLHADLEPLAFLLGTWRGEGRGEFPTIEPFLYVEQIRFTHVGEPFVVYAQRAWSPNDGAVLHSEMGFWRPASDGRLDVSLGHPIGVSEISEGSVHGASIRLRSASIGRAEGGARVTELRRHYRVEGNTLAYEVHMATDETPLARHLAGELRRL